MAALELLPDGELSELIYRQYLENGSFMDGDEAWGAAQRLTSAVVDVVLGSSWLEVTASIDSSLTQSAFLHGGCGYIAGELHRVARLPLVRFTSPNDRFGWRGHWAVEVNVAEGDDAAFLDIRGLVAVDEVLEEFAGSDSWTVERGAHLYPALLAEVGEHAVTVLDDLDHLEAALIGRYVSQLLALLPSG